MVKTFVISIIIVSTLTFGLLFGFFGEAFGGGTTQIIREEYNCWDVFDPQSQPIGDTVTLVDQFHTEERVVVGIPLFFCASAIKFIGNFEFIPPFNPPTGHHLTCYTIGGSAPDPPIFVNLEDQFGNMQNVQVLDPALLCAPTTKELATGDIDMYENDLHFKCYNIQETVVDIGERFELGDQFSDFTFNQIIKSKILCNPVLKFHMGDTIPPDVEDLVPVEPHLKGYETISGGKIVDPINILATDQFVDRQQLALQVPQLLLTEVIKTFPHLAVGGDLIPLDTTMVLVAGTHSVAAWIIPVIVSGIGFAIVILRKL